MPIAMPDLESYLTRLGDAVIFAGDPFTADGLEELGAKEGDVTVAFNQTFNPLKFGEATGEAVHESTIQGENPVVTLPMIIGNEALWAKLSATGTKGGGYSTPQPVVETSLVLVPHPELAAASAPFAFPAPAGPWATPPGPPVNWLWFFRGHFLRPDVTMRQADGQKSITSAQFQVMHYAPNPEGAKLYYIGNPRTNVPVIPVFI